jgi:glycosyltransferase involved in cell wall biosynthesis
VVPAVGHPDLRLPQRRPAPILLNSRAAARPTITGVERWTAELLPRLCALSPERYAIVAPPPRASGRRLGQAWEQLNLPLMAARMRAPIIFSPANLAPVLWPRNVLMLHDAAVLREPRAYSRAYALWHRTVGVRSARQALRVLTVSEFSRRELVQFAGLDPDRVVVVHGGVDDRFTTTADHERTATALGLSRPYVLTVATDDRRKNLPALADTVRRLNELGIDLVWAGEARPYFAQAHAIEGARALGYVAEEHLAGLYRGALAFVLPSLYEGLGLTCLEAMACGTPVVAADRAALPETCGGAALLVDPDDPAAIAAAVLRTVSDDSLRSRLRADGLVRAGERTWDHAARETDALLRGLLGPVGRRASDDSRSPHHASA